LTALQAQFESIPMVIGDWQGTARELPPAERAMAGAAACVERVYTKPSHGLTVSVLLLGGLPGKISTHPPDVCYRGSGYTLDSPAPFRCRYGTDDQPAEFKTMLAMRTGTNPSVLRIFWSWNASTGWSTPAEPRWTFAAAPALCKLYVIRETAGAVVDPAADPCNEFLSLLLPEIDKRVFATAK
jgi:hypothetical protein